MKKNSSGGAETIVARAPEPAPTFPAAPSMFPLTFATFCPPSVCPPIPPTLPLVPDDDDEEEEDDDDAAAAAAAAALTTPPDAVGDTVEIVTVADVDDTEEEEEDAAVEAVCLRRRGVQCFIL